MASTDDVLRFGDFRIDAGKRQLLRRGELVPLAPKAFDVLLLLARHNGQVLEKSELMKRLWPDSFVEEANLNVHISAIRKALGESAQNPRTIVTIPGRGYRFAAELENTPLTTWKRFVPWKLAIAVGVAAIVLSALASAQYFGRTSFRQSVSGRKTNSAEAYRYYAAGRHYWNKRSIDGLRRSIANFQKAIDEDPHYALPYSGLADAYSMLGDFLGRPHEYRPQAIAAAEKALQIDGNIAEAHASLAYLRMRNWEWDRVESEFQRAIAIDPGYATAHQWYSIFLELTGRSDAAIAEAVRAQQLDPLSPIINESLGSRLYFARKTNRAAAQLRKTIEIEASFQAAHESLAVVYNHERKFDEALRELSRPGEPSDRSNRATEAIIMATSGRTREARAILSALRDADPIDMAKIHAALGERDRALDILKRATEDHVDHVVFIAVDPAWDSFRPDARFQAILRRIGLA